MAVIRLMRPLGAILVISSALAARAPADPINDRADFRPPIAAGSSAAEGSGVADAAPPGASLAPDTGARSRAGNPLWTVPLSALSATRDRPLFSASRRPPIVAAAIVAPPPKREALAPPPPERPLLTLVGTIVSRKASFAMLQGSNADAISRLRVGQENDGWLIRGIGLRSIVVEKGVQSVELDLPRLNEGSDGIVVGEKSRGRRHGSQQQR
jgi:general secretion pathway protein N